VEGDRLRPAHPLLTDPDEVELVANFEGLLSNSSFSQDVRRILDTLEDALENPVDIEFAHDGEQLYLLQCRPQSSSPDERPDAIPQDLDQRTVVFTANRYVSNGHVPDLTHLVYVDPVRYAELPSEREMRDVGHAVGRLNEMLPKRQFALMGPGRWGSRGDIKLGVPITYSEINNSALLIEIARKKGGYVPDLSFGTHFFQDLVESHIRYLPLYPDESGVVFNEPFFTRSENLLVQLAPEYAHLEAVVKVIDVPAVTDGNVLRVLLNAELDQAVAMLCDPQDAGTSLVAPPPSPLSTPTRAVAESWRWRQRMAERIARRIQPETRGVAAMYLFGSVKNGTAGPGSDVDLLVHFRGDEQQRADLERWFEGWSECLAELNYLRTGYQVDSLLDVHFISDEDIEAQTSFAAKIGAITDAAAPLPLDGQDEG
jgi:predicted nucleotidyltransferase